MAASDFSFISNRAHRRPKRVTGVTNRMQAQGRRSIDAPMPCMMKKVCAQHCRQVRHDPKPASRAWCAPVSTRTRSFDRVDFGNLRGRPASPPRGACMATVSC
jgi:hypothetical protein